jgi:sugar lactone lactonase YvrE/type II secretory pathway pseudopilin PulG
MEKHSNTKGRPKLIVIAIILVVAAAIAFRYFQRSHISTNEALAVESLRKINSAEMIYATTYEAGFSPSLGALAGTAGPPTASAAGLLSSEVVSGKSSGYSFVYSGLTSGGRYDTYSITASPIGGAGHGNFYFTDQSGLIRHNATRPATVDDPIIPSDGSSNANGNPANAAPSDPTKVPPLGPTEVVKLNPAFDAIVPPDVHLELLADLGLDRGALTEGPVWIRRGGYLLFSEIAGNVIDKWTPDGNITVFLKDSGFTGTDPSTVGKLTHNGRALLRLIGSVGITVDPQGRVVFCAQGDRAIVRLEPDGKRTVLVDRFEGKRLNSPNDLVYKSDGALYFSDPSGGLQRGDNDPKNELQFNGVFLYKDGKLRVIDKGYSIPNGVALTPDQRYLYINYTMKRTIKRFKILPDDTVGGGEIFIDMSSDKHRGAPDGMKSDKQGNLYCSGPGGLWIMSPTGTPLGIIKTPKRLTNIAFGATDGKTLFMTTHTGELYRVRLKVAGVVP